MGSSTAMLNVCLSNMDWIRLDKNNYISVLNPINDELEFKIALGGGNNYLYITYKIEAHINIEKWCPSIINLFAYSLYEMKMFSTTEHCFSIQSAVCTRGVQ